MATLEECFKELKSRQARLDEARENGWRDVIPSEMETVLEFEYAMKTMLKSNIDQLIEVAGHVELGPLPVGASLAYSTDY